MLPEVCGVLEKVRNLRFVVDATLGLRLYGRCSFEMEKSGRPRYRSGPQAIEVTKRKLVDYGDRFHAVHGNFRNLSSILESRHGKA